MPGLGFEGSLGFGGYLVTALSREFLGVGADLGVFLFIGQLFVVVGEPIEATIYRGHYSKR